MSQSDIQHRQRDYFCNREVVIVVFVDIVVTVVSVVCVVCLKRRSACKAVLSEASVTRDKVPGLGAWGELSVRQYLAICAV